MILGLILASITLIVVLGSLYSIMSNIDAIADYEYHRGLRQVAWPPPPVCKKTCGHCGAPNQGNICEYCNRTLRIYDLA